MAVALNPLGAVLDSRTFPVNTRALKGGPDRSGSRGPGQERLGDPLDRGADRTGPPLFLGISGANPHDSQVLEPLVRGIPPLRRGPRRRRPAEPHADKGYGYDHLRRRRAIRHHTPARASSPPPGWAGTAGPSSTTMSWLGGCRRLTP